MVRPNDILTKHHNIITYGAKSPKPIGPKTWNQLPGDTKSDTSYTNFTKCIDTWLGPKSRYNTCMNI